jgi:hypothetical protein
MKLKTDTNKYISKQQKAHAPPTRNAFSVRRRCAGSNCTVCSGCGSPPFHVKRYTCSAPIVTPGAVTTLVAGAAAVVEARPVAAVREEDKDDEEEEDEDRAAAAPPVVVDADAPDAAPDAAGAAVVEVAEVAAEKATGKTTTVPASEQLATNSPLSSMLMHRTAAPVLGDAGLCAGTRASSWLPPW